jgi:hypothetical protein
MTQRGPQTSGKLAATVQGLFQEMSIISASCKSQTKNIYTHMTYEQEQTTQHSNRVYGQGFRVLYSGEEDIFLSFTASGLILGPTQHPLQWVPRVLSPAPGVKLLRHGS